MRNLLFTVNNHLLKSKEMIKHDCINLQLKNPQMALYLLKYINKSVLHLA